ncbi:MAG: 30S ribosomal protein S9 [Patescibacteria group bacterium]
MAEKEKKTIKKSVRQPAEKKAEKKTEVKPEKRSLKYINARGARKTSVAQTRLYPSGKGEILINGKPYGEYFPTLEQKKIVLSPLELANLTGKVNISIRVKGGGIMSQAGACRHSISRALLVLTPELRKVLKAEGYLKRDPRVKERKKPGLKRARRAPQWSKR